MEKNPEEGRLTEEQQAERVRAARKQTVQMRRQYRDMRQEDGRKKRFERWSKNHAKPHEETVKDMEKLSGIGRPLNRAERRRFAKLLNVFKAKGGWQQFNDLYYHKYGKRTTISRKKLHKMAAEESMADAIKSAKVIPKKESK